MNPPDNIPSSVIPQSLNDDGYAILTGVLTPGECEALIRSFGEKNLFRKTIDMKRYRFGSGVYKYFSYPLPVLLQRLRGELYGHLIDAANYWNSVLKIPLEYPSRYDDFARLCHDHGQTMPTPLILKYEAGDYNTLHQDLYGKIYFPFQVILMLSQPGRDFTGGEIVLTEQRPRAQSAARVIQPKQGDAVIITTNFRPARGAKGYYRTVVRHGVSVVTSGMRFTAGLIFHDSDH